MPVCAGCGDEEAYRIEINEHEQLHLCRDCLRNAPKFAGFIGWTLDMRQQRLRLLARLGYKEVSP